MEFIKNTLACSYCGKTLQSPVTLPCGITICKHHIIEEEKQFDCIECDRIHPIPSEGFQINKKLDQLLKSELNNLYFGEEYQTAVDALKNLEKSIDSYRLLKQDPSYELDKVFGNLKGDIEFKREQLKLQIDTEAEILVKQVVDYENECKKNIAGLDFKRVDEKVEKIEDDLKNSKEDLKKLVIDKSKWKVIQASLESHTKALNEEFKIIRTSLFLYKLDIYQREKKLDLYVGNSPNLRYNFES
jgi:chromosome segregation ATPase